MNKINKAWQNVYSLAQTSDYYKSKDEIDCDVIEELVSKATPKKPIKETFKTKISEYVTLVENKVYCPTCKLELHIMGTCCSNNNCRQAIDWSNE